jgi:stage II sporulation protein M
LIEIKNFPKKIYIFLSFLLFFSGFFGGYFWTQKNVLKVLKYLLKLQEILSPVLNLSPFFQFLFVFFNNSINSFLVIFLGSIFCIFPTIVLLVNGGILGSLFFLFKLKLETKSFFLLILPHGIFEVPAILLSGAAGLSLGVSTFKRIFRKQRGLKKEFKKSFSFFFKTLIPLWIVAAFVEIFFTPLLK